VTQFDQPFLCFAGIEDPLFGISCRFTLCHEPLTAIRKTLDAFQKKFSCWIGSNRLQNVVTCARLQRSLTFPVFCSAVGAGLTGQLFCKSGYGFEDSWNISDNVCEVVDVDWGLGWYNCEAVQLDVGEAFASCGYPCAYPGNSGVG
jgi:hypothetical protein